MLKPLTYFALLVCAGLLLSGCSNRRAAEAQFLGTWSRVNNMDSTADLTFFPDHTFISSGESLGEYTIFGTGKWYLDYKRILLREKPLVSAPDDSGEAKLYIINIADVTPDELKISHKDWIERYRRVKTMTRDEIQSMAGKRVEYSTTP
jgi:hypothetical protein